MSEEELVHGLDVSLIGCQTYTAVLGHNPWVDKSVVFAQFKTPVKAMCNSFVHNRTMATEEKPRLRNANVGNWMGLPSRGGPHGGAAVGKTHRGLLWDPNGGAAVGQEREVGAAPQGGRCGPVEGKGGSPMGPMGL